MLFQGPALSAEVHVLCVVVENGANQQVNGNGLAAAFVEPTTPRGWSQLPRAQVAAWVDTLSGTGQVNF